MRLRAVVVALTLTRLAAAESTPFERDLAKAVAVPGGLTAREVAERASSSSFDVGARRAELAAAAAGLDQAYAAYLPRAALLGRYTRLSDSGDQSAGNIVVAPGAPAGPLPPGQQLVNVPLSFKTLKNQWSFQASLSVPISDYFLRLGAVHASARAGHDAAREALVASERQARADAAIAYWVWVRAELDTVVAERALEQAKTHLADAKVAEDVGSASRADVLRSESQVARTELLVESSKNLAEVAEERLRIVMRAPEGTRFRIGEDPRVAPPPLANESTKSLLGRAIAKRPELASLRALAATHRRAARAERAGQLPRLDGFANYYYANPNQRVFPQRDEFKSSWDLGLSATWVLSDIPGAGAAARGELARAQAAEAQAKALEDRVRLEVTQAQKDAREADLALRTTEKGLSSAEEAYRVRRIAFQNGKASSTELLDAETDLTRARFEALGARVAARVARVRLAFAVGDDVAR